MSQILQQLLKAQHCAELEQNARQSLEKTHITLTQQYLDLQMHNRDAMARYNRLHQAWVTAEMLRQNAESQSHRERHACQVLNLALKHEKELRKQMSSHLEHTLMSTEILSQWLHVQQIKKAGMLDEQKEKAKHFDLSTFFITKESLEVEDEQLQLGLEQLRAERATQ